MNSQKKGNPQKFHFTGYDTAFPCVMWSENLTFFVRSIVPFPKFNCFIIPCSPVDNVQRLQDVLT